MFGMMGQMFSTLNRRGKGGERGGGKGKGKREEKGRKGKGKEREETRLYPFYSFVRSKRPN